MKFRLLAVFSLVCFQVCAQSAGQDFAVNQFIRIPKAYTDSSSRLSDYIRTNFKGPDEQTYAAYRWVTDNIKYDKDSMLYINWNMETEQKIAATLRRKKGVCDNFASVFADLLCRMQIPAYVVNGLTRQGGRAVRTAHSWVAVKAGNEWLLCDPTWDAAFHPYPRFYLKHPSEFINTHWPFDPMWQVSPAPISLPDFENGRGFYDSKVSFENPGDSINTFLGLSTLQQLEATTRRMKASEKQTETTRNWAGYNNMNIAIIYGEQDMNLYNDAVADLNKANHYLNSFLEYRNNLFEPSRTDEQIQNMLEPVKPAIADAYKKIAGIGKVKENFQYDTGELKERLKKMETKLQQQKDFLQRYLSTTAAQRKDVFY